MNRKLQPQLAFGQLGLLTASERSSRLGQYSPTVPRVVSILPTASRPAPVAATATGAAQMLRLVEREVREIEQRSSGQLQQHRRVAPEPFEAVDLALVGQEGVDHHVAKVHEHPPSGGVALDPDRLPPRGGRAQDDGVGDRLHLAFASTARDDEHVREGGELGHVQDDDVLSLPVTCGFDHEVGQRARAEWVQDGRLSVR